MKSRLDHLELTDFRSYTGAALALGGRGAYLVGPNGAGKTNLLEAVSFLSPGRGLRGATLAEVGRRAPAEAHGRPWAVFALVATDAGEVRIGTGVESIGQTRRQVRIDGKDAPQARLVEHLRPLWLTPSQDRLFLDAAADRRRFLDRLVFAAEPGHAGQVAAYDRALRERTRLLGDGPADEAWLGVLETRLASAGAAMAGARARTLADLAAEIAARGDRPFPRAGLALSGEWETLGAGGASPEDIEARLAAALAASRGRDAAAGRALVGPHRGDLVVTHLEAGRAAAECSTGEQKALILNLVLAQAARLSRANSQPNPILLLDEVAAHLDGVRRGALFDEIEALSLQALLTGTDESLFETLKGRALRVQVDASSLTVLDDR